MDIEKIIKVLLGEGHNIDDLEKFENDLNDESRYFLGLVKEGFEITDSGELDSIPNLEEFLHKQTMHACDNLDENDPSNLNIILTLSEHFVSLDFNETVIRKSFALGLFPMAGEIGDTDILFIRHHDFKLIIKPEDFRIPHNVPDLIKKKFKDYTITFNRDFEGCIRAIQKAYPENWLRPKLVDSYIKIHKNPDNRISLNSVEIWNKDKLVAGEIGFITGNSYASLTGFHTENDIGNVQMALLGQFLFEKGFAYWDLGMSIPYKYRYGAKSYHREAHFKLYETLGKERFSLPCNQEYSPEISTNLSANLTIENFWNTLCEEAASNNSAFNTVPVGKNEEISTKPEDIIPFSEPNTKYKEFGRSISEIDWDSSEEISLQRLYSAYMQGVFPWWDEDNFQPHTWYSPDPRFVILPDEYHCPKSLKKFMKKCPYTFTMDRCFNKVIKECARMKRPDQEGTWIGNQIIRAYTKFHKAGFAHSFEVWHKGQLAGGFYGVLIGSVFFGESMFTIEDNSSKCAFALFMEAFTECGGKLVDCQVYTDNMARYGGKNISRDAFLRLEKDVLYQNLTKDFKETFTSLASAFHR